MEGCVRHRGVGVSGLARSRAAAKGLPSDVPAGPALPRRSNLGTFHRRAKSARPKWMSELRSEQGADLS